VVKDAAGNVTELRCTFDPDHSRKVKGTIHWVSASKALTAEVRLYDHLFAVENPDDVPEGRTFLDSLNPNSLEVIKDAKLESSLAAAEPGSRFQFERVGYFYADPVDSNPGKPVFNRTATLRSSPVLTA
jgi:glutaminyl-tRNA synthetase